MEEVIRDRAAARAAGERGRRFIFDWLDPEAVSAGYERMYRDAVARGLPPFTAATEKGQAYVA